LTKVKSHGNNVHDIIVYMISGAAQTNRPTDQQTDAKKGKQSWVQPAVCEAVASW